MSYNATLQLLGVLIESTEGTDSTPGTASTILTRNFKSTFLQADSKDRTLDRPFFGAQAPFVAGARRRMTFEIEMAGRKGTATTPPSWMDLNRYCGMSAPAVGASSVVQSQISSSIPSATLYSYIDNLLIKMMGARGSVGFTIADDEIPYFSYEFLGIPDPANLAVESAQFTPDYTRWKIPDLAGTAKTSFSLDGYSAPLRSITMNNNADLQFRSLIGPADRVILQNRSWSGTIVLEMPSLATKNYFTSILGTGTVVGQVIHGTTTGNIVQIDMPQLNIGAGVETSNEQGIAMLTLPITAVPSSAGNDELTITTK